MWQHEINDFDMAGCVDENCNSNANCVENSQFGCGHFTQQIWKGTTHMCYQDRYNIIFVTDVIFEQSSYILEKYAKGPDNREYVVARYSPPGNFISQFHTNLEAQFCSDTCASTEYASIGNTC